MRIYSKAKLNNVSTAFWELINRIGHFIIKQLLYNTKSQTIFSVPILIHIYYYVALTSIKLWNRDMIRILNYLFVVKNNDFV